MHGILKMERTPIKLRDQYFTSDFFTLRELADNYSQAVKELEELVSLKGGKDYSLILKYRKLLMEIISKKQVVQEIVQKELQNIIANAFKETATYIQKRKYLTSVKVKEIIIDILQYLENSLLNSLK